MIRFCNLRHCLAPLSYHGLHEKSTRGPQEQRRSHSRLSKIDPIEAWSSSERPPRAHVSSIFNKLGVSSRAEAVAVALQRGLLAGGRGAC